MKISYHLVYWSAFPGYVSIVWIILVPITITIQSQIEVYFQISYFVPKEAVPGRLALLLTLFLCLINTLNTVVRDSPKSGGKASALMIWIMSCITFNIVPLIEYACILSHDKYLEKSKDDTSIVQTNRANKSTGKQEMFKRLDKFMAIISPPVFIIFAFIFWASWSA